MSVLGAYISTLFPAKMTVLGDRNQSVNPLSSSTAESICTVLPQADCVYMRKSYRSTVEITNVAQSIIHNPDLIPIDRHGEPPRIRSFTTRGKETEFVREQVGMFAHSGLRSMGLICKTQESAKVLYELLSGESGVRLIDAQSKVFSGGILIAPAYLAKGLEFDAVVVPHCNESEYRSTIDRHMLYVAVTRAMHTLTMTYTGQVTPFLTGMTDQ